MGPNAPAKRPTVSDALRLFSPCPVVHAIWDYAMWSDMVPTQANPARLVRVADVSKRQRQPRPLRMSAFQIFVRHLDEPFRTIACLSVCFGLRISECLALKWSDISWLEAKLSIQRSIVRQPVGDVKTAYSKKTMPIDSEMLHVLESWRARTQFSSDEDWVFASPAQLGRLPWSADGVNDAYRNAASIAGIGQVTSHTMRHTYRSWLDAVGTSIAVPQKLMWHADIRTTMNVYGDVVTDEMEQAHSKVVPMALAPAVN
jgi:integrase